MKFKTYVALIYITTSFLANAQGNASITDKYENYRHKLDHFISINNLDSIENTVTNYNKYLLKSFPNEEWRTLAQNSFLIDVLINKNDFLGAKRIALKNSLIQNKYKDTLSIGFAYNLAKLGNIQLQLNENNESLFNLRKSGEIFKLNNDSSSIPFIWYLTYRGATENHFSNFKESIIFSSKADSLIESYINSGDRWWIPTYINNLFIISACYEGLGEFSNSLEFRLKLKKILEVNCPNSEDYIKNQFNISVAYIKLGKYLLAEEILLSEYGKFKKNNKYESEYLQGLATLYSLWGDETKAQKYFDLASKIKPFNNQDLDSYTLVFQSASNLQAAGNFSEAIKIFKFIVDNINKYDLPKGKIYLMSTILLCELASSSATSGDLKLNFDLRKRYLVEAGDLAKKLFGVISNENAMVHAAYGHFYYFVMFDNKSAITNYKLAIDILNNIPNEHRNQLALLGNYKMISNAYEQDKDYNLAYTSLIRANVIQYKFLENYLPFLSEFERDNFVLSNQEEYSRLKAFLWRNADKFNNSTFLDDLLLLDNYYSGLSLNTTIKIRNSLNELSNLEKLQYLKILDDDLENSSKTIIENKNNNITETEIFKRNFLKAISKKDENKKVENIYLKIVNKSNFDGAIAVFQRGEYDIEANSYIYSCILISKDKVVKKYLPLFKETSLDSILINSKKNGFDLINSINDFYSKENKQTVRSNLLELFKHLKQYSKISIVTSGKLNFINFGAIELSDGTLLGENHEIIYYNSLNDFIKDGKNNEPVKFDEIDIFSGSNYDYKTNSTSSSDLVSDKKVNLNFKVFSKKIRSFNNSWSYLPGSKLEGNLIEKVISGVKIKSYSVKKYEEGLGDEASFRKLLIDTSNYKILHLATHGFFFDKLEYDALRNTSTIVGQDNSAFRSGLILSGGNVGWKNFDLNKYADDGILTSYEISKLNLRKVKLLVLSACDTGLGDIKSDEGVFGLQRALKLAGAEKIIMSLWKVPDLQTKELMTYFYQNLTKGYSINSSLSKAQSIMKSKYPPYYWAAFKLLN